MTTVEIPWGAWYEDAYHALTFPTSWQVDVLPPSFGAPLEPGKLVEAIEHPIESPPFEELVSGASSLCLVVDDLARPTRPGPVIEALAQRATSAGMSRESIRVVVATGSHAPLNEKQLAWKLGETVARDLSVESHDCHGDLVETEITYGDQPLRINRTFYESDVKVTIGSVLPHSFAGNSGGAKLILPGLSGLIATARSHKFVQLGLRGGADPNENRFRTEAEQLARQLGVRFSVHLLCDMQRETTAAFAGDLVAAHRAACRKAVDEFRTPVNDDYDALVMNCFPKDVDLVQAENAFVAMKTLRKPIVRDEGVLILTTAASEGIGQHGLFEPGGVSYRQPRQKRALGSKDLWIYAPSMVESSVRQLFWEGYPVFQDSQELVVALEERLGDPAKVAILPCSPMQQLCDMRDGLSA